MELPAEGWTGRIGELTIGATKDEGGTRGKKITVGGQQALNFIDFDAGYPNPPVIAVEVFDVAPELPNAVTKALGDLVNKPVDLAKKASEEWGADLICLKMVGTNPEEQDRTPEETAELVDSILKAVPNPIIVYGCGHEEKDAKVMQAVGEVLKGENCVIGSADEDKYKSMSVAAMGFNQNLVGFSNLDINLAKQLNILLTDFGVKKERIIMDPLMAGLGYGLDYSYSVIERIRIAALMGDAILQCPLICDCSVAWNAREATQTETEKDLGDVEKRGIMWETTTTMGAITAGSDIVIMRHPEAIKKIRSAIKDLGGGD